MLYYAKIINKNGKVDVGFGYNAEFYQANGFEQMDVEKSDVDGDWYVTDKCPHKSEEQKEQEELERKAKLRMTKRDFFLYVVKPFGITHAQLEQALKADDTMFACYDGCGHIYRYDTMLVGAIKPMLKQLTGQTIDEQELNTMLDTVFEEHNATD